MKYRKVGSGSLYDGVVPSGGWTKTSGTGKAGCAVMKVKTHRGLPTNMAPDGTELDVDSSVAETTTPSNADNNEITQHTVPPTISEEEPHQEPPVQVPVSPPKPTKELKYTVDELLAPPKDVVEHYFNLATQQESEEMCNQLELVPSGLLSLEEVLLPAVVHQENQTLRQIQRKIQRDAPHHTHIVVSGRAAVRKCLNAAAVAARDSRLERRVLDDQREGENAKKRQLERDENRAARSQDLERRRTEEEKTKELQKAKEAREMKKKYTPNQELWREVAYLMTESSKLEREGRLWAEAEMLLDSSEKAIEAKEEANKVQQENEAHSVEKVTQEDHILTESTVPSTPFESSMQDIIGSSDNIQTALKSLTQLMAGTDKLRKDLYRRYRQDHQFEGYRGVHNPKGLIRILSQDEEEA